VRVGAQLSSGLRTLSLVGSDAWVAGSGGAGVIGTAGDQRYLCGLVLPPVGRYPARMIPIAAALQAFKSEMPDFAGDRYPQIIMQFPHALSTLKNTRQTLVRRRRVQLNTYLQEFAGPEALAAILSDKTSPSNAWSPEAFVRQEDMTPTCIVAQGGAGKTAFMSECIEKGVFLGIVPFWLDVGSVADVDNPQDLKGTGDDNGVRDLFDRLAVGCSYSDFQRFVEHDGVRGLLIVDGLNETTIDVQTVFRVLEYIVRHWQARLLVVGVDRIGVGHVIPPFFRRRATLRNLERSVVEKVIGDRLGQCSLPDVLWRLLRIPFFLDLYVSLGDPAVTSRPALFGGYFRTVLGSVGTAEPSGLPPTAQQLARLAFNVYTGGRLVFRRDELDGLGQDITEKLVDSGMMEPRAGGRGLVFRHQLIHDFLAGWHLAHHPGNWGSASFDALTLHASSADAVVLATECIDEGADRFIGEVYDWNWQTAVSCIDSLLQGPSRATSGVSDLLVDAILAIIAIKRFDRFNHTRARTRAMSPVFDRSPSKIPFNTQASEQQLRSEIATRYGTGRSVPEEYARWKELFLYDGEVDPSMWPGPTESPLIGWTAANVFKRRPCSQAFVTWLGEQYTQLLTQQQSDPKARTARWRIVHVLGNAHEDAVQFLEKVAARAEEGRWVRFGAVRSLAELASRMTEKPGREVLGRLAKATPELCAIGGGPAELRKLSRLADDCEQGAWWPAAFAPVLQAGLKVVSGQADTAEKERWERAISESGIASD
jgi:hypothetical protein